MRVEVLTDRPAERFVVGARLFPEGTTDPLSIVEARPANPGWVLRFREVPTREAAEAFRLAYLEVEPGPGDALPRGSYYWHEMLGVTVRDLEGADIGTVRDVYRAGGGDVLDVTGGPRGDFDLPIARPFIRVFAPRRGEIVADPEALDLPTVDEIRPPRPPRPPRPRRATRRRAAVPMTPRVPTADASAEASDADANPASHEPSAADAAPPADVPGPGRELPQSDAGPEVGATRPADELPPDGHAHPAEP
jgi:16S rRNA processing protein RimM